MSKSSKTVIASAIVGALALTGSHLAAANSLDNLNKEEVRISNAAAKSTAPGGGDAADGPRR